MQETKQDVTEVVPLAKMAKNLQVYPIPLITIFSTITTLMANSADDKLVIYFSFFTKTGFNISCKLSPNPVFWEKYEKYFNMSLAENFTQSVLSVNVSYWYLKDEYCCNVVKSVSLANMVK